MFRDLIMALLPGSAKAYIDEQLFLAMKDGVMLSAETARKVAAKPTSTFSEEETLVNFAELLEEILEEFESDEVVG